SSSASPTPSATVASPTPSASPTSEIPAAAREKTDAGAEAFVKYFFDRTNEAWTAPAVGLIPPVSETDCKFCVTTERRAEALVQSNEKYLEAPILLAGVQAITGAPEGQQYVGATLNQREVKVVDAAGEVVRTDQKKSLESLIGLKWRDGKWSMFAVEKAS
ncbi:MAG: DUF6318 family protein, partial [Ornithinibacter sp.]